MKKICICCKKEFDVVKSKRFCSLECEKLFKNETYKFENTCECCGTVFKAKSETTKYCSITCINKAVKWGNPANRAKQLEKMQSTTYRENMAATMLEKSKDEQYLKNVSDGVRRAYKENPEYKEKLSIAGTRNWGNEEYADRCLKNQYGYKDFVFPSGNAVRVQGCEDLILSQLLNEYAESEISVGVKQIFKKIGKIYYTENGIERVYWPDIYIEKTNTIIEVKSSYTFEKWIDRNELKKQACIDRGFNFEYRIVQRKRKQRNDEFSKIEIVR